jgi:signal peptidase I
LNISTQARQIIALVLIAIGVFFVSRATVQSFYVLGSSMLPSLEDGQRLIVDKAIYHVRDPRIGDIIVFHPPNGSSNDYIKRIVATPGDTIEVRDGTVFINGTALNEPYINERPSYTFKAEEIPEGEYFVLGDNRNNSNDSHRWGTVPEEDIIGKAWLFVWPPGVIPSYDPLKQ